jgi:hypothetical protein
MHDKKLFFVHVMKTGGASIRRNAAFNHPAEQIYPNHTVDLDLWAANATVEHLVGISRERHRQIRFYSGHLPFFVTRLLPEPVQTMTLLRNPVDRIVSHLRQCQHLDRRCRGLPIEQIYDDPWIRPMLLHNHQVKMFALSPADRNPSLLSCIEIDERRLGAAKDHLAAVDVLGLHERYSELLDELTERFGWRCGDVRAAHGVPPAASGVAPSLLRRIAEDNAPDISFYEYAVTVYEKRRRRRVLPLG